MQNFFTAIVESANVIYTAGDTLRKIYLEATPREIVEADRSDMRRKLALYCTAVALILAVETPSVRDFVVESLNSAITLQRTR